MEPIWILAILNAGLMGLLGWEMVAHAKLVRDLTAKLMARNLYEYGAVAEDRPKPETKIKKNKITDPILGQDY